MVLPWEGASGCIVDIWSLIEGPNNEMSEEMREFIVVRTRGINPVVVVDKGLLFIDWQVKGEQ